MSDITNIGKDVIEQLCKGYSEGKSLRALSREFNIHPQTVKRYLELHNVYFERSKQEYALRQFGDTEELESSICDEYLRCRSIDLVSKKLNVSRSKVYRCLQRNNVDIQSRSEAAMSAWCTKHENEKNETGNVFTPFDFNVLNTCMYVAFQQSYVSEGATPFNCSKNNEYAEFQKECVTPFGIAYANK